MGWYSRYPRYVSVAERKQKGLKEIAKLKKTGVSIDPIVIEGKTIAKTFWGKAWCENLELYSDFENRLPRGRTYVRNGSVMDLQVKAGEINALVAGSSLYKVNIKVSKVLTNKWNAIVKDCAGKIDSLIELLQGKFSKAVMEIITNPKKGLFPHPSEIKLKCSCPDWADMCKHVAAVLYGVGARLDNKPEEMFVLRQADHVELIASAGTGSMIKTDKNHSDKILADTDLSSLFGIDMASLDGKNKAELKTKAKKSRVLTPKKKTSSVTLKKVVKKTKVTAKTKKVLPVVVKKKPTINIKKKTTAVRVKKTVKK